METTIENVEKEPQEVSEPQNVADVETVFSTSILDELESTLVSEQKTDNAEVNVKDI
jgi:hypothetical protein